MTHSRAQDACEQNRNKRVHPFFNQKQRSLRWISALPTVLVAHSAADQEPLARSKVAAFDLDSTLIKTRTGRVFAKDSTDWQWWHTSIPEKLEQLYNDGFRIVILSNQNGLQNCQRIKEFKSKVEAVFGQLKVPVWLMAAMQKDRYRKPMPGMWEWLEKEANEGMPIAHEESFFVGDAAANVNLKFLTPEEFFLQEKPAPFSWGPFVPSEYPDTSVPLFAPTSTPLVPLNKSVEIIVFVGNPACGKSTFAKKYLIPKGYVHVNQDTLRTKEKCVAACQAAIKENKPVVIDADNTNPDVATRAMYIDIAKKAKVPIRCFVFTASEHLAKHNNYYRGLKDKDADRDVLSDIVFRSFKSRLQEPKLSEGFEEIKQINFVFEGSDEDKVNWLRWWI
ncbi:polynucleotide kinase 3 phosphatase-domain-containing protein [Dichotomocladium elegans]|nr:polynucleotide kinase 3 phosphatase-domain-containing protein [Dichotomocladium elegans]